MVEGTETHCHPNAFCVHVQETHDFRCECKPGFNGTGDVCDGELLIRVCVMKGSQMTWFVPDLCDGFCHNEGKCSKDKKGQPFCTCSGSFVGKKCMEKSDFAYIAGGIAAVVFVIILLFLLIWMICVRYLIKVGKSVWLSLHEPFFV